MKCYRASALLFLLCAHPVSWAGVENILGQWTAKAITPNGPMELELEIKLEGNGLVGTLAGFQGAVPLTNLKFEDPDLSLEVTLGGATFKLTGVLKDGKFDGNYEQVGTDFKGPWTAERKVVTAPVTAAGEISGSWTTVSVTPHGDLTLALELKQEADTLTGTLGSEMGMLPIQAASFKDNKLQFDVEFSGTTYRMEAVLQEGKFSGRWSGPGGTDSGVWSATRKVTPPAAPAAAPSPGVASAAIDGAWNCSVVTPDGNSLPFELELQQAGESVTGSVVAPEGKIPIQSATFANNTLTFEIEYAGSKYRIQASMEAGKFAGKWSALNAPDSGPFSATRK